MFDFVKVRTRHGPSRAGERQPARGFRLAKEEGFGEETALLWDPSNDWCSIQYNHYGVRAAAMADYLGRFVHDDQVPLELVPKIDEAVQAKINTKGIVTKVMLSVAPKKLDDKEFKMGASLGQAVELLQDADADQVEIIISTRRRKRGLDVNLKHFAKWINKLKRDNEEALHSARVAAKERVFERSEILDLLHQRVTIEEELKPGRDKRYPQKDRWNALRRAHAAWKPLMV